MRNYKEHFSRALQAAPERLHFAAHSHHLWPDVSFEAQVACWEDAARLADRKWDRVFGEVVPDTQSRIAKVLNLSQPAAIAFAPNTHEFLRRLLSCLPTDRPLRILTSDGEFHSFTRQIARLEEDGLVMVIRVPVQPFDSFAERFVAAGKEDTAFDLIYVSQVFFNSGFAIEALDDLVRGLPGGGSFVAIDGYHGFLAKPTDLSAVEARVFYLSGGYKYAMAGEGVCFLHAPEGYGPRPRDTGWYAAFGALERQAEPGVAYAAEGARFLGATFDPVGIYRLRAVLTMLEDLSLGAFEIHDHALALQRLFIEGVTRAGLKHLPAEKLLLDPRTTSCGQFLTFDLGEAAAVSLQSRLLAEEVITDQRAGRLRFGFGIYQDAEDVEKLLDRLARI